MNNVFGQEQAIPVSQKTMISQLKRKKHAWQAGKDKRTVRVSKCGETYLDFFKLYEEYNPLLCQVELANPWVSEAWEKDGDRLTGEIQCRRVQRWAFSSEFLLMHLTCSVQGS